MLPHAKTLVQRLEDRPFTMLGINSDGAEVFRTRCVEAGVTWPVIHDGGTTNGPIASTWGVLTWPQLYVLDAEGRIRFKNVFDEDLDRAVDALLAE